MNDIKCIKHDELVEVIVTGGAVGSMFTGPV